MKLKYIFLLACASLLNTACSDFLDLEPLSDNSDTGFFTAENQLEAYCNAKYDLLPEHSRVSDVSIGYFGTDDNSDNQANVNPNDNFIPQRIQVGTSGSYGNHGKLRDCNRFLFYTAQNITNGTLTHSDNVKQYIGEMYFFRAYIYFNYLKSFGDFPILTAILTDGDYQANVEASKRKPRNEVARFILQDLDNAIANLQPRSSTITTHRLNRESALLFKSRVALYEGTWETYHQGTARVPGGPGWPGGTFEGNLATEINFFLTQAMEAAKLIADAVPTLEADYAGLFNKTDYSSQKEILLWRMYSAEAKISNYVVGSLHGYDANNGVNGNFTGYTRSLVESFLTKDGLPWYKNANYTDATLEKVTANRDDRLNMSMAKPGDKIIGDNYFNFPAFIKSGSINIATTGYILRKSWVDNDVQINSSYPLGLPIFRAAEAYLNYIEADYVKNKSLDNNSKAYWKELRKRANVDTDFQKTIDNTDLSKELDLGKYSGTATVNETLYNIRRERRCEFIAEGLRKDDLYRWRSLDMMKDYQTEGFNFWDVNYQNYPGFTTGHIDNNPYIHPYWNNAIAKDGYNFEEANYLSPLSYDVFRLSTPVEGGDVSTSVVYQNPGWPIQPGAYANK